MSKWNELMAGRPAAEPPENPEPGWKAETSDPREPEPAPARRTLDNSEFMGYLMAVLFPQFGVLVGCALIIRGNERGASIVGWSALSFVVWLVIVVVLWGLWLGSALR